MYISTRSGEKLTASQAILKGLSSDGGLFIPESIEKLNITAEYFNKNYKQIAKDVFSLFLDDFTDAEIDYAIIDKLNPNLRSIDNYNECPNINSQIDGYNLVMNALLTPFEQLCNNSDLDYKELYSQQTSKGGK